MPKFPKLSRPEIRLPKGRSSSVVALDIGSDAVVVLQSSGGERGRVRRALVHPLPPGLVVDGEVVDCDALSAQLRELFSTHGLPRDVRVGLAHPRLMVRLVELPTALEGDNLDAAVRHLAGDLLPVALDQLVIDYGRVEQAPAAAAGPQQRVLMAAARLDAIERLTRALEAAGLRVLGIQLSGLALLAALDHPPLAGEAVLYVQAGALTNVVISEDGAPVLVRAASAGSEAIAAGLAERAGISHEQARSSIAALGLHGAPPASPISDELETAVTQQVREGLRRVVAEIQSSRGFYAANPDARPIGAVVLTGAMTTWPGVAEALEAELHLPVLPAGRESWPDVGSVGVARERLDVAVGLTLAAPDVRPDLRPGRRLGRLDAAAPGRLVAQVACVMVALAALAVVYLVMVSNQVSSDQAHLQQIRGALVSSEQQAAALKPYDDFAKAALARRDAVTKVAATRFDWDRALSQLSQVTAKGVWLTSVRATLGPTSQIAGATGSNATSGLRGAVASPALELAGCGERDRDLPAYMDRLHEMTGVTDVGFSTSERLDPQTTTGTGTTSGSASGGGTGGDCRNGDGRVPRFEIVVYFKADAAQTVAANPAGTSPGGALAAVAPSPGTGTTAAPAPATTPAPAATPAAGAGTPAAGSTSSKSAPAAAPSNQTADASPAKP